MQNIKTVLYLLLVLIAVVFINVFFAILDEKRMQVNYCTHVKENGEIVSWQC